MSIDLTFDGSTDARGRNGWFQLREASILPYINPGMYSVVYLDLYSKTRSKNAPIQVTFHNPEELKTLIAGLAKAYAQMTTPEETTA